MTTLWQKNKTSLDEVINFTSGNDRHFDLYLAPYDVIGSLAHIQMLASINLLTSEEYDQLKSGLQDIHQEIKTNQFSIEEGVEDVHSQVELLLTKRLGDVGKKIHSGRSRNDQALVDIKLFMREELKGIITELKKLFDLLLLLSERDRSKLMPGYTHFQPAMPSSFGLWFGAYAESLSDDMVLLRAAYEIVNKNPLGSAAGYGSSFPLNRTMTTQLLGFEDLHYNAIYAQMCRGKTERVVASALANIAATLSKWAMDACLFMSPNYGFISFPDNLTTGSSIMPHKKNPDVLEIIRARCNQIQGIPNSIALTTSNLPSGYHRDLQVVKEQLFPTFKWIQQSIEMAHLMLSNIETKDNLLKNEDYKFLFSVEEVNRLVLKGIPFRDAYKQVGVSIEDGTFSPDKSIRHVHEGSIGNLNLEAIKQQMEKTIQSFPFQSVDRAISQLMER